MYCLLMSTTWVLTLNEGKTIFTKQDLEVKRGTTLIHGSTFETHNIRNHATIETRMDEAPTAIQLNRWHCSSNKDIEKKVDMHPHNVSLQSSFIMQQIWTCII